MLRRTLKPVLVVLLLVTMLASVAACGSTGGASGSGSSAVTSQAPDQSAAAPDQSTAAPAEQLSGKIHAISWNNSETAMTAGAKKFMEENPGVTVEVEKVPDDNKLYTQLAAGSGIPDIMQFQNRDNPTVLAKYPGSFADITDIMKPEEANFMQAVLPLCREGDTYYAVPWDVAPAMTFYRKDIFQDAGVDPNSLKTWDDFITAGKQIDQKTNGKVKMFGFDYNGASSFDMPGLLFYELGGSFYDKDGNVKFDSPEMIQAFQMVQKFIDAGITVNLPNEWSDRLTAIENNTLATVNYGIWFTGTLSTNVQDQAGKWGMIPLPAFTAGGGNQANSGGSTVMLYAKSENLPLAKAFTKWFLMSDEGNAINLTAGGLFDAYTPSYKDPSYSAVDPYFGISTAQFAASVSDKIPLLNFPAYFTDVINVFQNNAIGQYFVQKQDLQTELKAASDKAQKTVDNLK